jgi:uncharacterized membrane protein YjgN (DUF898 family)
MTDDGMLAGRPPAGLSSAAARAGGPDAAAQPAEPTPSNRLPLTFTGSGGEYFGIWVVNLLLTILTLGIYSAWAKVRRVQYFYRNTRLDGSVFDYHGRPGSILKGRLIALALLGLYNLAINVSVGLAVLAALVVGLVLPWLLVQTLRFRLHNASYRGLRLRFTGEVREAYLVVGVPLLAVLVAGAAAGARAQAGPASGAVEALAGVVYVALLCAWPWLHFRFKRLQHNGTAYGQAHGRLQGGAGRFYAIYGKAVLMVVAAGAIVAAGVAVAGGVGIVSGGHRGAFATMFVLVAVAVLGFYATLLALVPFISARTQNAVWCGSSLGALRFESRVGARRLAWISITNVVLILLTVGMFTPFGAVRLYRYRLESVTVLSPGDLAGFVAQAGSAEPGAVGEGAADLLDFDFAL